MPSCCILQGTCFIFFQNWQNQQQPEQQNANVAQVNDADNAMVDDDNDDVDDEEDDDDDDDDDEYEEDDDAVNGDNINDEVGNAIDEAANAINEAANELDNALEGNDGGVNQQAEEGGWNPDALMEDLTWEKV